MTLDHIHALRGVYDPQPSPLHILKRDGEQVIWFARRMDIPPLMEADMHNPDDYYALGKPEPIKPRKMLDVWAALGIALVVAIGGPLMFWLITTIAKALQ